MRIIRSIALLVALTAGFPAVAYSSQSAPPAVMEAATILAHLDLNSFPNSTGPRRRPSAHTVSDYGLTKTATFPDGWAQASMPDDSWHMAALLLQKDNGSETICFTDSAGGGGTYRSTRVLRVMRQAHARWVATEIPDRPDCKNAPALSPVAAAGLAPAEMLQHLDDFRDSLSLSDRRRLDRRLRRSSNGGVAQCDDAAGSRASCEVAAYMQALGRTGLLSRFLTILKSSAST